MVEPRPLRIRLLGGLDVEGVSPTDLGSRKARTLVKVLALGRAGVVSTGAVIEALWPDGDAPARAVEQVGVLVSRLRRSLGAGRLVRSEGGWALVADWLDVVELEARAAEAEERLDAGQHASARAAAQAAVDVMRGPLLPEDDGPWVEGARALCERLGGRVRLILAEAAWAAGDAATATSDAERALDADPYDEVALRVAMRALAASGRPASALALYSRVRELLAEQLGVSPTAETEAVHDEVLLTEEAPVTRPRSAALVGRAADLVRLDVAAGRLVRGAAWTVEVVGDAGIGKTALLDAWAAATSLTVLRARCDELGRDLPLQPVLDALGAEDPASAGTEVGATSVVDPAIGRAALFAGLLRRLDELTGPTGVALVFDDVHWADAMTLAFCRAARRKAARCLIVVVRRTGPAIEVVADECIEVGPLALTAVTELVGSVRAPTLHERSGGNPLFLLHLAASGDDEDLPASVRDAVSSRVADLGTGVAATMRAAAVLGVEIDLDLLSTVLRTPAVELLGQLDAGVASGLLDDHGVLAFSHALVRDALVVGSRPSRAAWLHREAAAVLAGRPEADDLAVARHALAGGNAVLASASLARAAAAAAARFDVEGAEGLLDQALAVDDTAVARLARARVRIARYSLAEAAEDAQIAATRGAGAEAFEVAGWAAYYRRDYAGAVRFADEGAARAVDDATRASCLALGGRVRHSSGDLAGAESVLTEALRIAPGEVRGLALVWLSCVRSHQSQIGEAVDLAERALLRPQEIGHPFAALHGRFARVTALGYGGRVGEALTSIDEAMTIIAVEGEQASRFASIFLNTRGWLLRNLGLLDQGDAANLEALDNIAVMTLSAEPYHVAHLDLLDGAIARGQPEDIARRLSDAAAVDHWDGGMSWRQKGRLDLLRARIALRGGDLDQAVRLASSVQLRASAWPVPRYRLMAELVIDEADARRGTVDPAAVAAHLRSLADVSAPEAWWRTAELAVLLGNADMAGESDRLAAALVRSASDAGIDASAAVARRLEAIRTA